MKVFLSGKCFLSEQHRIVIEKPRIFPNIMRIYLHKGASYSRILPRTHRVLRTLPYRYTFIFRLLSLKFGFYFPNGFVLAEGYLSLVFKKGTS